MKKSGENIKLNIKLNNKYKIENKDLTKVLIEINEFILIISKFPYEYDVNVEFKSDQWSAFINVRDETNQIKRIRENFRTHGVL